jgi:16S rRNA A1518/A1519 N6-dimethyltransferase RsmA/KsgA/DIM1 with predicted DNA glycosylase/AP lyase activity
METDYEKLKYETEDFENHITVHWGSGTGHKGNKNPATYSIGKEYKILDFFKEMVKFEGGTVLEVGPGRGKFANLLFENYPITSYTVVDLKKNFADSEELLKDRAIYVESKDYEQVWNKPYDLFVSTFVISETPFYYKDNIYEHVIPNCKTVFIIDGDANHDFNNELIKMMQKNFSNVAYQDSGMHKSMAITGSKL